MSDVVPGIGGEIPEPEPPEQRQQIIDAEKERQEQEAEDFAARSKERKEFYSGKGGDEEPAGQTVPQSVPPPGQ